MIVRQQRMRELKHGMFCTLITLSVKIVDKGDGEGKRKNRSKTG